MKNDVHHVYGEHYSYADQTALSRAVDLLSRHCGCHDESQKRNAKTPPTCSQRPDLRGFCADGAPYCAFEPGSTVETDPDGRITYSRAASVHQSGSPGQAMLQLDRHLDSTDLPQLPDTRVMDPGGNVPCATLAAGFRILRMRPGVECAEFLVPSGNNGTVTCDKRLTKISRMRHLDRDVKRAEFMRLGNYDFFDEKTEHIWEREEAMCLEQLKTLDGDETFTYHWDSTLVDLEDFVSTLNRSRPVDVQLDTVFVDYGVYMVLFGRNPETLEWTDERPYYRNMVRRNGITFLYAFTLPADCAFATSSAQGPVFVHGPSVLHCTDSEIRVRRHFDLVAPPPSGAPDVPWGVRFNTVMEWQTSKKQSGEGTR